MKLNLIIAALLAFNSSFSQDSWDQLKATTQNAAIIGLGEESHGVESFNQIKADVTAFLVKEKRAGAIVFEASFVACMINYLNKTPFENRIKQSLYPFWNTASVKEALKEFANKETASGPPLITGCDPQEDCRLKAFSAYLLTENIISKTKAQLLYCDSILSQVIGRNVSRKGGLTDNEYKTLLQKYDEVRAEMAEKKNDLGNRFVILDQCFNNRLWLCKYVTAGMGNVQRKMYYRDSLMAQNIIWLKNNFYQSTPFIFWAANLHVAKLKGNGAPEWAGEWISGQNYYSICINKGGVSSKNKLKDDYSVSFRQGGAFDAAISSGSYKKISSAEWVTPCD